MELGYAGTELRRELVDAVLRGDKTATAGLHGEDVLANVGERWLLSLAAVSAASAPP
jgi:hypothetical protein